MPAEALQLDVHAAGGSEREESKARLRVDDVGRAAAPPPACHRKLAVRACAALTRCVVHVAKRAAKIELLPRRLSRYEFGLEGCAQSRVVLEDKHVARLLRVARPLGSAAHEERLPAVPDRSQPRFETVAAAAAHRLDTLVRCVVAANPADLQNAMTSSREQRMSAEAEGYRSERSLMDCVVPLRRGGATQPISALEQILGC